MNYLHTPPTKIVRQFVNFRFILPRMAASLFGLSLIVLSFTVTISSLHSLKYSIWYTLQIGLVIKEFDFGTLTMAPQTLSSFPLMSSATIPIFHVDLGFLSSSRYPSSMWILVFFLLLLIQCHLNLT